MSSTMQMSRSWLCATSFQVRCVTRKIRLLQTDIQGLHLEKKTLEQKNQELANAFREKSKAQQRLQTLYQRLKSQQNATQTQNAAADEAEHMIQSMTNPQFDIYRDPGPQRPSAVHVRGAETPQVYTHGRVGSAGSNSSGGRQQPWSGQGQNGCGDSRPRGYSSPAPCNLADHKTENGGVTAATPAHRIGTSIPAPFMYAGRPSYSNADHGYATVGGGNNTRQVTPNRQPLGSLDQNILKGPRVNGNGPSGSAKVSRLPGGQFTRNGGASMMIGRPMPHVQHR